MRQEIKEKKKQQASIPEVKIHKLFKYRPAELEEDSASVQTWHTFGPLKIPLREQVSFQKRMRALLDTVDYKENRLFFKKEEIPLGLYEG
jgi:hypothetical protein